MKAFYSDHFVLPLPQGHRFPMQKYGRLRARIAQELTDLSLCEALPATDGQLALAHHPAWIEKVCRGGLTAQEQKLLGFPWSAAMAERSRRSVGATIGACEAARHDGFAAIWPEAPTMLIRIAVRAFAASTILRSQLVGCRQDLGHSRFCALISMFIRATVRHVFSITIRAFIRFRCMVQKTFRSQRKRATQIGLWRTGLATMLTWLACKKHCRRYREDFELTGCFTSQVPMFLRAIA